MIQLSSVDIILLTSMLWWGFFLTDLVWISRDVANNVYDKKTWFIDQFNLSLCLLWLCIGSHHDFLKTSCQEKEMCKYDKLLIILQLFPPLPEVLYFTFFLFSLFLKPLLTTEMWFLTIPCLVLCSDSWYELPDGIYVENNHKDGVPSLNS